MFSKELEGQIPPEEHRIVRSRIRGLIGRAGITWQDARDLEQQFLERIVKANELYDAARGARAAFIWTLTNDLCKKVLRHRRAKCRHIAPTVSLSTFISDRDEGRVELAQVVSDSERANTHRGFVRTQQEMAELRHDLAAVIADLPAEQAELAQRLMHESLTTIANDTQIARTTLHEWITKIRERFERSSLQEYL